MASSHSVMLGWMSFSIHSRTSARRAAWLSLKYGECCWRLLLVWDASAGLRGIGRKAVGGDATYALVPAGIRVGNHVAERLQRLLRSSNGRRILSGLGLLGGRRGGGLGRGLGRGLLGLGVERADGEPGLVLLKHALVVVLPEDLGGVLTADALENLLAACWVGGWWLAGCCWRFTSAQFGVGPPSCDATTSQLEERRKKRQDRWEREHEPGWSSWNLVTS